VSSSRRKVLGLIGWLALCAGVAVLGAVASITAASFYAELKQPPWAPPAGVFGPVWTLLYVLMAVAAWRVWLMAASPDRSRGLGFFLAQLALNALWSWLFFAWHLGGPAFIDVLALFAMIVATVVTFWRVDRIAGALLMPYLIWVGFACVLNLTVWQLNPEALGA